MKRVFSMVLIAVLAAFTFSDSRANVAVEEMVESAQQVLNSLSPEQRQQASFAFGDAERFAWEFESKERKGLPLKSLTKPQRDFVHGLLDATLSQKGFIKATSIISLETLSADTNNAGLYHVSFFGIPEPGSTWGWRFEGHHLSLNVTVVNGRSISVSPSFFGASPAQVADGPRKGTRVLATEGDLGRELWQSLDEEQKKEAVFASEAPQEIVTGKDRRVLRVDSVGLPFSAMNRRQGELLLGLIREFLHRYRSEVASGNWEKIQKSGLDAIRFAWAGGEDEKKPSYYRVQGPTFLIEYVYAGVAGNHAHSVWRDLQGDFADDLLGKQEVGRSSAESAPKP